MNVIIITITTNTTITTINYLAKRRQLTLHRLINNNGHNWQQRQQ